MEAERDEPYGGEDPRRACHHCHTDDRNPNFHFEESWKEIQHGSGASGGD
jgi:hypothetical protein